jgi:Zn-dependent peptidase ImmA (M78 family)
MPRPIPANVTPTVLAWARNESGLPAETVAKRLAVKVSRISEWESGARRPTVRQVQQLAQLYRRPFGLFFRPDPPVIEPLAADYRRLPGVTPGAESPEFRLALRVMLQHRDIALELGDDQFPPFGLNVRLEEATQVAAERVRSALGVTDAQQTGWDTEWTAWREWRTAVERLGALVFQFPKVPLDEARGVALPLFPLPAIGINSKETSPGARVFTLIHELVHLGLAKANEESPALRENRSESAWQAVERFVEDVAGQVLMPAAMLDTLATASSSAWTVSAVRRLARRFKVTPRAMVTRLRAAGRMSWDTYQQWLADWNAYLATLPPQSGGFATPVDKTLGRAGRHLVRVVLDALDSNRITAVDASRYLELRFDHFNDLRQELRAGSSPLEAG